MVQQLILPSKGVMQADVVGANNTDAAFEFDVDQETLGNPVPSGFTVTGIRVIPHNAAAPHVAVATVWRLRLYSRNAKGIEDLVYEDTRYTLPASNEPSLDITPWFYQNEDSVGSIYGTIGIENAATDCSFLISIEFERRSR